MIASSAPKRQTFRLADLRSGATRLYTAIAWLHIPAVVVIALWAHNEWFGPALALTIAALVVTVAARVLPERLPLRLVVAAALTAGPIAFVYAGRGDASGLSGHGNWQIDYHMYFFALFAMLVGYVDWRPIALAAAITAGHHLLLDVIAPSDVFPQEGIDRAILHAITVIAECAVLFWIVNTVRALFARIDDLMDFTAKATADAIADEMAENERLRGLLAQAGAN